MRFCINTGEVAGRVAQPEGSPPWVRTQRQCGDRAGAAPGTCWLLHPGLGRAAKGKSADLVFCLKLVVGGKILEGLGLVVVVVAGGHQVNVFLGVGWDREQQRPSCCRQAPPGRARGRGAGNVRRRPWPHRPHGVLSLTRCSTPARSTPERPAPPRTQTGDTGSPGCPGPALPWALHPWQGQDVASAWALGPAEGSHNEPTAGDPPAQGQLSHGGTGLKGTQPHSPDTP